MFEQCFTRCLLKLKNFYNQYFTPYSKISREENISENWIKLKETKKPIEIKIT